MKRTTRIMLAAAVLAVAGALVLPAGAEAASDGEAPRRAAAAAGDREANVAQHRGLDRTDAAVALAILAGVCAMAVRGDAVIGSMVVVASAAVGAATRPLTGRPRRGPGWSDWPGPAIARGERFGGHRPRSGRPRRLVPSLPQHKRPGNHELH